jgi:hypothetical protein
MQYIYHTNCGSLSLAIIEKIWQVLSARLLSSETAFEHPEYQTIEKLACNTRTATPPAIHCTKGLAIYPDDKDTMCLTYTHLWLECKHKTNGVKFCELGDLPKIVCGNSKHRPEFT